MTICTQHDVTVAGTSEDIYNYLADVSRWPAVFGPTVFAEPSPLGGNQEDLHIWATANGQVRSWVSRRVLDPGAKTIKFSQNKSQFPLQSMTGQWIIAASPVGSSVLNLIHEYELDEAATAEDAAFVARAVDENSRAELMALKRHVELGKRSGESFLLQFSDVETIDMSAEDVFAFLDQADLWASRLPHVVSVDFERTGEIQRLRMVTTTPAGDPHNTESVRISFPSSLRIVYKQQIHPAIFLAHTGKWEITALSPTTCRATSSHTVVLNPDAPELRENPEGLLAIRAKVRHSLGTNSLATLRQASGAV